jgi:hypothetical protein
MTNYTKVNVRRDLLDQIRIKAAADGRSITNYIEQRLLADDPVSDLVVKSVADSTDVANPPELNQLIYSQVLELIGKDSTEFNGVPLENLVREAKLDPWLATNVENRLRQELRNKAKAKYIGGDSE